MESATVVAHSAGAAYQVDLEDGGHQWLADEPKALGGGDTGPNPMQLLCSSLAACTAITLRMYAQRKEWPLEGVEVRVTLNPEGTGKDEGTVLKRTLKFEGQLDSAQRQRLVEIANVCPTHKILAGTATIPTEEG